MKFFLIGHFLLFVYWIEWYCRKLIILLSIKKLIFLINKKFGDCHLFGWEVYLFSLIIGFKWSILLYFLKLFLKYYIKFLFVFKLRNKLRIN